MQHHKRSGRAEELWTRVMREGRSIDDVARQHALSPRRIERIILMLARPGVTASI